MDAAVVALSILTVRHMYKYTLFDLRAVWAVISQEWQHMQPMVVSVATDKEYTTFVNDKVVTKPLSKREAQGKLIVVLRDHPAFVIRERTRKMGESRDAPPVPVVGFSRRFLPQALSALHLHSSC